MSTKEDNKKLLTFGKGNAKLDPKATLTFSLPAGYTCPGARECLARADVDSGRIVDGPNAKFRCFAASQEAVYSEVRRSRWHNFNLLMEAKLNDGWKGMAALIIDSLPKGSWSRVRIHVSGDFFSPEYFQAWLYVARAMPDKVFYAYTKSLHIWKAHQHLIPDNFRLTASMGGKFDVIADEEGFVNAEVIFHPDEAGDRAIDHDDSHAYGEDRKSFALLLHGVQKAGSEASAALKRMKNENIKFNYGKTKPNASQEASQESTEESGSQEGDQESTCQESRQKAA